MTHSICGRRGPARRSSPMRLAWSRCGGGWLRVPWRLDTRCRKTETTDRTRPSAAGRWAGPASGYRRRAVATCLCCRTAGASAAAREGRRASRNRADRGPATAGRDGAADHGVSGATRAARSRRMIRCWATAGGRWSGTVRLYGGGQTAMRCCRWFRVLWWRWKWRCRDGDVPLWVVPDGIDRRRITTRRFAATRRVIVPCDDSLT